jgi:hypothetical protein
MFKNIKKIPSTLGIVYIYHRLKKSNSRIIFVSQIAEIENYSLNVLV